MALDRNFLRRIYAAMRSPRGRDLGMFLIFVIISSILWVVLTLNEEEQQDFRMPLKITNVPDSITLVSTGPEELSVSLRAKGTQLLKMNLWGAPTVNCDFRAFRSKGGVMRISSADLKAIVRNATGGAQVSVIYPDTLHLTYTTHPGFLLPVKADCKVTPGPQSALLGNPKVHPDSVRVFVANNADLPYDLTYLTTEPIRILGLDQSVVRWVKVIGPANSRLIPDSVEVAIDIEPMIFKSRKVVIEPINVPNNIKLITFPAQVDAFFMVPMSAYTSNSVKFRVVADYRTISQDSRNVKLKLIDVPDELYNVQLSVDSAEYIIERH